MNIVRNDIRNVAIIAHVDHGKTTLVDALLRQSGNFRDSQVAQDTHARFSNPLERERGITILAKNCRHSLTDPITGGETVKINLIDTPGHADFGGEVERVLVDGGWVFSCSSMPPKGPMPQTRFVLEESLSKRAASDRRSSTRSTVRTPAPTKCSTMVFDLFVELGARMTRRSTFPVIYASGRAGTAIVEGSKSRARTSQPVFEAIMQVTSPPRTAIRNARLQIQHHQHSVSTITSVESAWVAFTMAGSKAGAAGVAFARRDGIASLKIEAFSSFRCSTVFGRKNIAEAIRSRRHRRAHRSG